MPASETHLRPRRLDVRRHVRREQRVTSRRSHSRLDERVEFDAQRRNVDVGADVTRVFVWLAGASEDAIEDFTRGAEGDHFVLGVEQGLKATERLIHEASEALKGEKFGGLAISSCLSRAAQAA
jgi:hypothetical protein